MLYVSLVRTPRYLFKVYTMASLHEAPRSNARRAPEVLKHYAQEYEFSSLLSNLSYIPGVGFAYQHLKWVL